MSIYLHVSDTPTHRHSLWHGQWLCPRKGETIFVSNSYLFTVSPAKYTKLTKVLCYCGRIFFFFYKGALLLWEENTQNLQRCFVTVGGKYTKLLRCFVTVGGKYTTYKGALLLWEGNTQNLQRCFVTVGEKYTKLTKLPFSCISMVAAFTT